MECGHTCAAQMTQGWTQSRVADGVARMPVGRFLGLAIHITRVAVRHIVGWAYVVTMHAQEGHKVGMMVMRYCHVREHGQQGHQHDAGSQPVT